MKKKGIAIAALIATSVALIAAGCKQPNNPNNPNNPNDPDNPGGPTGDTYEDYVPDKQPGGDQFDFEGNYKEPELKIDGKGDDAQWQAISTPLLTYGKNDAVSVKVYRGESALFFLFDVKDTRLLTWGESNDDTVTRGDSVEFYIDSKADGGRRPQNDDFQINLGIHGKTRIMQGSGVEWGSWNGLIDYEVTLNGTLNDSEEPTDVGYTVEAMVQYKDIAIDKNATIGLAFGQVDKVAKDDAASGTDDGPWNWYGWHYNGDFVDPKIPDTYVLYQPDGTLLSRDEQEKAPAEMAGYVKDQDGNAVGGATVSVTGGVTQLTPVTTDEAGFFMFENVDPEGTYEVTVSKAGHISGVQTYTRAELRAADGGRVLKEFVIINQATVERTTLTGTVKNVLNGVVGGATVTYKNTEISTTTNADGTFSLADIPMGVGDVAIVVTATDYAATETVVKEDALTSTATALGDVNLNLPAAETRAFATKELLAANNGFITRTLDGIEMEFAGERTFNGWIELYFDTKTSTTKNPEDKREVRDNTDVQYQLKSDGTVAVINYGGGNFTASGIKWTVNHTDGAGYTAKLFIPYTTLKISPLEPFGISLGQNNGQGPWDGWGRDDMKGTDGRGFVAPEIPSDYVRVGADNKLYEAANNERSVTLSGNVGIPGVNVAIGSVNAVTNENGGWSVTMPATANAVSVVFTKQGYVPVTKNIEAGYFDSHYTWSESFTMQEKKVSIAGQVTDGAAPIAGVRVEIEGSALFAVTDAQGMYTIQNVPTFSDAKLVFTKEGYADGAETVTAANLAKNDTYTLNKALTSNADVREITVSGKIIGVEGPVAGATVAVAGNSELTATTNASGEFTIEHFAGVDCELNVTKENWISGKISFSAGSLGEDATYRFADFFLQRDYAVFGRLEEKSDATKKEAFADFTGYVTRSATAFEFKFVGTREWKSTTNLELHFSLARGVAKEKSINLQNNATGGEGYTVKIENVATTPVVQITVLYSWLGVAPTDIIGITVGQFSSAVGDWDTWVCETPIEANNANEYVRLAADNSVFRYDKNSFFVTLSGNAGAGVAVSVNGKTVTSGADGAWSMKCDKTSAKVTVTYTKSGYVTETTEIEAGYFDDNASWTENVTLELQRITVSGTVTDTNGGVADVNVTVTVTGGEGWTATTDGNGRYTLTVTALEDIKITFSKTGYADGVQAYTAAELTAAEDNAIALNVTLISESDVNEVTLTGTVVGIGGAIAGATVEIRGTAYTATTDENGAWTMVANGVDCTVTVTKAGYLDGTLELKANEITGETHAMGELFLAREYVEFAKSQKTVFPTEANAGIMAGFSYTMTRMKDGLAFRIVGNKPFTSTNPENRVELNLAPSSGTAWTVAIRINAKGTVENGKDGITFTVKDADTENPVIEGFISYAAIGVSSTDVIRIAGGQWCNTGSASDWNGTNFNGNFVGADWGHTNKIYIGADNRVSANAADVQ